MAEEDPCSSFTFSCAIEMVRIKICHILPRKQRKEGRSSNGPLACRHHQHLQVRLTVSPVHGNRHGRYVYWDTLRGVHVGETLICCSHESKRTGIWWCIVAGVLAISRRRITRAKFEGTKVRVQRQSQRFRSCNVDDGKVVCSFLLSLANHG